MIRRSLLTSVLVIAVTAALTPSAFAQTVDVPFSGTAWMLASTMTISPGAIAQSTVANGCSFNQQTPGYLVGKGTTFPTQLVSLSSAGGVPSQISVSCNQPVNLSVSAPTQTAGSKFNPVSSVATVETSFGRSTNSGGASLLPIPVGTTPLVINISVDKGSFLEPGNYSYNIRLTIVP